MMMRTALIALGASLVLTSTSACAFGTEPATLHRIVGRWDWVESTGGIAGVTLTPASTGHTRLLQFLPTGQVRLFEDGSLVRAVSYGTLDRTDSDTTTVGYTPPLMGFDTQTATFPTDDELVLTDPCCDGFTYRWVRAP